MYRSITKWEETRFVGLLLVAFIPSFWLDLPLVRPALGICILLLLPGYYTLQILDYPIEYDIESALLSIVVSLVVLMFGGVLFHMYLDTILGVYLLIFLLSVISWHYSDDYSNNIRINRKDISMIMLSWSVLFVSICGVWFLREFELGFISIVAVLCNISYFIYSVRNGHKRYYPLVIFTISLSLGLMYTLRFNYLPTYGDVSFESYILSEVVSEGGWTPDLIQYDVYWARYSDLLSVTTLPYILYSLLGWETQIYQIIVRSLASIIPLCSYYTLKTRFSPDISFYSSILVSCQFVFITLLSNTTRTIVSFVIFFTLIMVLLGRSRRTSVPIILLSGVIVSHYGTAIFTIVLFCTSYIVYIILDFLNNSVNKPISVTILLIGGVFSYVWYSTVTGLIFEDIVQSIFQITAEFLEISDFSQLITSDADETSHIAYANIQLAHQVTTSIYYSTILIGGFGTLITLLTKPDHKHTQYLVASYAILFVTFVLTQFYGGYGPYRVYYQLISIISPSFLIPIVFCSDLFNRFEYNFNLNIEPKKVAKGLIILFVVLHMITGTYLIFQLFGVPHSEMYNSEGQRYERAFVTEEDHTASEWICEYNTGHNVNTDYYGGSLVGQCDAPNMDRGLGLGDPNRESTNEYILLRCTNTINNNLDTKYEGYVSLDRIENVMNTKNKIHDTGCTKISI
ncbi:DUF2206 domain-containing protein [Halorubrum ezzemoulense]|uniref:DUF2206 domain-containing protein n=1 Tax=Halorubrum ezzemoulense TaxID=337243 RepID=UPI002330432A|nr:DUF2206 domain-containing protein [Halorubrum ezzemoulense]MDB2265486.1 DUF2206 domain-containing protein [Halorubrum ezzemoulense]MDB9302691.1 DUF2206 domain-containing protein [Halorubrum ezzemoulense]